MSSAFAPPDTLSDDDIRTLREVRRAIWINGLLGQCAGIVVGAASHIALQALKRRYVGEAAGGGPTATGGSPPARGRPIDAGWMHRCLRPLPPLGRNTFMLSALGAGALGSYVMSATAGKNAVHLLHPIFNRGRNEHAGKSPYQIAASEADATGDEARPLRRRDSMERRPEVRPLAEIDTAQWWDGDRG